MFYGINHPLFLRHIKTKGLAFADSKKVFKDIILCVTASIANSKYFNQLIIKNVKKVLVSQIRTKNCILVADDVDSNDKTVLKALKKDIPIVSVEYVIDSLNSLKLLDLNEYKLDFDKRVGMKLNVSVLKKRKRGTGLDHTKKKEKKTKRLVFQFLNLH